MKVLLDIQVLGYGTFMRRRRRGIFRYVENLANALSSRSDIDLSFCCSFDEVKFVYSSLNYLDENPAFNGIPFIHSYSRFKKALTRHFVAYNEAVRFESTGVTRLMKILIREQLRSFLKIVEKFSDETIDSLALADVDIFHSPDFFYMPSVVRSAPGLKNFVTVNDIFPIPEPHFSDASHFEKVSEKLSALDRDDWILTISQYSKDALCNFAENVDPEKVFVTPLAAASHFYRCDDPEKRTAIRERYLIPRDFRYLLSVGVHEKRKNCELTIRSFEQLLMQENIQDLVLVLVGQEKSDYRDFLDKLIAYPEVRNRILFTGYVPDSDLAPLYSDAAAFLFPSFYEGFGLPPLEAMQCGVPVVVSNTSSLPEVVGEAGIFIDPESVDDMSDAVLKILRDPGLRETLSQKAIARARKFSWEKHSELVSDAYRLAMRS